MQIVIYRRLQNQNQYLHTAQQKQHANEYKQIESLFSLFSVLKFKLPLPPMRDWAISPDFANTIISLIYERRPKLILEVGSGVSTILEAYCLNQIGGGTIISLENDPQFSVRTAENIKKHGMDHIAQIVYAPLKEVTIGDGTWLWYDPAQLVNIKNIDLLVIDGPPRSTQKFARYPAMPILFNQLSDDAIIVLDDALREDEKQVVELWLKEFNCFQFESIDSEKGTIILHRIKSMK